MTASRAPSNPTELLHLFYEIYQDRMNRQLGPVSSAKNNDPLRFPYYEVKTALTNLTNEEVVIFCRLRPQNETHQNINGLWLALWSEQEVGSVIVAPLLNKIAALPPAAFDELDFTASGMTSNSGNQNTLCILNSIIILNRVLAWPDSKLATLPLDTDHVLTHRQSSVISIGYQLSTEIISLPGGTLVSIAQRFDHSANTKHLKFEHWRNFARLTSLAPPIQNEHFDFLTCSKVNELGRLLYLINKSKCIAIKHADSPIETVNDAFETICKPDTNNAVCFFLANYLNSITSPNSERLKCCVNLLERVKPDVDSMMLYHESQLQLANHYFTESHTTLASKLLALKKAFSYAVRAWLSDSSDNRLIFKIAEAFLYASTHNLNKNSRGINLDLHEFDWLREEMEKAHSQHRSLVDENEINKLVDYLFNQLSTQRNLIAPLITQMEHVAKENEALKLRMSQLEERFAALATTLSSRQITQESTSSPRLFKLTQ